MTTEMSFLGMDLPRLPPPRSRMYTGTSVLATQPADTTYLCETDVSKYAWQQEWHNPVHGRRVDSSALVFESFITPILIYKSCLYLSLSRFIINTKDHHTDTQIQVFYISLTLSIHSKPLRSHTHPSHSETARLLTSYMSLGLMVPHVT